VSEQRAVTAGAVLGALIGAAATYLFFTERGKELRDKLEPAVNDLQREFTRFRGTIEQFGHLANDGMRVVEEFRSARGGDVFSNRTSH
jgi:gas vesicle protein